MVPTPATAGMGLRAGPAGQNLEPHSEESMSLPPDSPKLSPATLLNEEARMRQALGLRDGGSTPRPPQRREPEHGGRRFVKDGDVPVVVLTRDRGADASAPVSRVAAAEAALRTERTARERAERALHESATALQALQTRLAHAELAHREALAAERAARETAEQALAEARALLEARPAPAPAEERRPATPPTRVPPKPRRPAAANPEREPEPVKWWLPSYRAKLRRS
ncbi:MAG: hypothetical protein J0I21_21140 [Alphaproteobacteria bacterium]|nr:hypothetical protein [Alphaproteobacteria bacterium]